MNPDFLTLNEVLEIHRDQIERYGGSPGIRDLGLLQSAMAMPKAGVGETYFHEDLFAMAAAYLFHIVRNHSFIDGNKRTGLAAALIFLDMNGIETDAPEDEIEEMVQNTAAGKQNKTSIAEFFRRYALK